MNLSELLKDRLSDKGWAIYRLHAITGGPNGGVSTTAIKAILNGKTKFPEVETLRKFAKAFNDPIKLWMEVATYQDGIDPSENQVILSKKGVRRILEIVETVPEEKMDDFVRMIEIYARGIL